MNKRFFYGLLFIIIGLVVAFFIPPLLRIFQWMTFGYFMLLAVDLVLVFISKTGLVGKREMADKLSNGDINKVTIHLKNNFPYHVNIWVIDEIPEQFQIFDFSYNLKIKAKESKDIHYDLTPKERGIFEFKNLNVFVTSPLGLMQRRIVINQNQKIKVYPSFLKLKKYDLVSLKHKINELGIKKSRRLGHSLEFEQIKEYAVGDDFRTLNWKATAKTKKLMVNQYIDEKSQQIYCAIDKGRVMKTPFNGMSLLDYSINTSLIVSNIVIQNQDRAGIFTFSKKIENFVKAEKRNTQMGLILESLFNVKTDFKETDFGNLYNNLRVKVTQRSLLLLFTNFETLDGLRRQLPYLQAINKNHLLLVVMFKNVELEKFLNQSEKTQQEIYEKSVVEKFLFEKKLIGKELQKFGIKNIQCYPEELTIETLNKYLEIKSKSLI